MDNKFIVYSHVNKITNVTYVGITKRKPELRWANGFGYNNIEDRLDYILRFHRRASNRRSIIMKSLDGSITKEFESLTEAAC